jgi:hypothetical protein
MLPNFIKVGILIDFKINQDFIAEVFCINKDKPMLSCNGKCYLAEQLKKADAEKEKEKQAPSSKKLQLELIYCYTKNSFTLFQYDNFKYTKLNTNYENEKYSFTYESTIFHPPKFRFI